MVMFNYTTRIKCGLLSLLDTDSIEMFTEIKLCNTYSPKLDLIIAGNANHFIAQSPAQVEGFLSLVFLTMHGLPGRATAKLFYLFENIAHAYARG